MEEINETRVGRMAEDKAGAIDRGSITQSQNDFLLYPKSIRKHLKAQGNSEIK